MILPPTYGECLREIMQAHRISISELSRKMGFRSSTSLVRILQDECSFERTQKFHQQFKLIFSWLISPEDAQRLAASLERSRLGADGFVLGRAIEQMIFADRSPAFPSPQMPLLTFSPSDQRLVPGSRAPFSSLAQLMVTYESAQWADVLLLGEASREMCTALARLIHHASNLRSMRHYFALDDTPSHVSTQISAILPLINAKTYKGLYCLATNAQAYAFLRSHRLTLVRFAPESGGVHTHMLIPLCDGQVALYTAADGKLFDFYQALASRLSDQMRSVKSVYPQPESLQSVLELTERYLLEEGNRLYCSLKPDLGLPLIATDILVEALDGGSNLGLPPDDPLMLRLIAVQQARFENMYHKKQPSYFVFSKSAFHTFAQTGHQTDHFFGMRDYTVPERARILQTFVDACKKNVYFHAHFLKDDSLMPAFEFTSFSGLGMQITPIDTDYNIASAHSEVLVSLSDFTQAFEDYFINTLIPQYCQSEAESIAFLESLIRRLGTQTK